MQQTNETINKKNIVALQCCVFQSLQNQISGSFGSIHEIHVFDPFGSRLADFFCFSFIFGDDYLNAAVASEPPKKQLVPGRFRWTKVQ